ncbi:putative transferase CAF17 homolog, mitochondrial [Palaemon carinicauda]|uniref:putative transferase CAF17 homolog, mitochondrial n=1 Tax=Palaemon carinicauda TaxID=392227 RepID=UPI0035B671F9
MLALSKSLFQKVFLKGKYVAKHSYLLKQRLHAEAQRHRSLIQVQGSEAASFLQGLITNDVEHLEEGATSIFSMLLNTQGRILFDSLIYKKQDNTYLLECDAKKCEQLVKHLKMYRVRRKINIDHVDGHCVWAVFDNSISFEDITPMDMESLYMNPKSESKVDLKLCDNQNSEVIATRDPRLRYLGHRLIIPVNSNIKDIIPDTEVSEGLYKVLRYRLGVCEGIDEIPPTKCFPLEANCDYLHGVSFHKGCYIGQELTARTFHTGVVRKRYMPIVFSAEASHLTFDSGIVNDKGKVVGKVRGIAGAQGIGLMRIEESLAAKTLTADNLTLVTSRPAWWPFEASKERAK